MFNMQIFADSQLPNICL